MRAREFIFEAPGRPRPYEIYKLDNEKIEELRNDPRVRAMLDLLGRSESATYDTLVGYPYIPDGPAPKKVIKDYSDHPRKPTARTEEHGPSAAAGKFQIVPRTWDGQVKKLTKNGVEIKGFYPPDQEKVAISILNDIGALDAVLKGNFKQAVKRSASQWMSLPGTHMPQGQGPHDEKWVNDNIADLKKQYELDKQKDTQVAQNDKTSPIDKIRDVVSTAVSPGTAKAEKQPQGPANAPVKLKQGYYTVGDSHAQGVGSNSNDPKKNIEWTNFGRTGASAFSKEHLENIKKIPAGSVVTLSMGANDLGSKKLSDIVDQVNKTIAASKAQGHKVVYLLPTASSNPNLQQKREELRQALLKSLESRDILDLGTAPSAKELKGGDDVHLGPKGYQKYGEYITQMLPLGANVEGPKTATKSDAPSLAPQKTKADSELSNPAPNVSVKTVAPQSERPKSKLTLEPPDSDPEKDPKAWAEYDRQMEKIQAAAGEKFSQERAARLEKERREQERREKEQVKTDPNAALGLQGSDKGKGKPPSDGPKARTGLAGTDTGTEKPVPKVNVRKEFEKEFALQRDKQGAGGSFDWRNPVTGKTQTFTTSYRDEKPVTTSKTTDTDKASTIDPKKTVPGQNIDWKTIAPELFTDTNTTTNTDPSLAKQYIAANLEKLDRLLSKSTKQDDEEIVNPDKF